MDDLDGKSTDSSFYGDEDLKSHLESIAASFDPAQWWDLQRESPALKPAPSVLSPEKPKAELYNQFEGNASARQLSETVPIFLARLPPSTTPATTYGPWIYVANPHAGKFSGSERLSEYVNAGQKLLDEWLEIKGQIGLEKTGRPASEISRAVTKERQLVEQAILDEAVKTGSIRGKWMLFPTARDVDEVWAAVAKATVTNDLGVAAKVATDDGLGDRVARLICVYTKDFSDVKDVTRVLLELVDLEVVEKRKGIYYKADALTHLDIKAGNAYGFKASMYSSKELLAKR